MVRTALLLAASLLFLAAAQAADPPPAAPVALERMLHGTWAGPACGGDWTYEADGTFTAEHYSPGGDKLAGTWAVRWNAIPPVLVRTCKTSDDPELVGKTWEVKLVQLDDKALAYQHPDQHPAGHTVRYTRVDKAGETELAALQGTWTPLEYEEKGEKIKDYKVKHIIQGDQLTVQANGKTIANGTLVLDATKNPKHLEIQFTFGRTDLLIYARAGNHLIYCGNRDGKTRPSEFASGTAHGGEYLLAWKIER